MFYWGPDPPVLFLSRVVLHSTVSGSLELDLQKVLAGIKWKLVPILAIRYAPWHSNGKS